MTLKDILHTLRQGVCPNPPPHPIYSMAPASARYYEALAALMFWMQEGRLPRWVLA